MVWIGGAPGASKSILAGALARAQDLPPHPVESAPVRGFLNLNRRELPCGQAGLRAVARGFGELVGDQLLKRGQRGPRVLIRSFSAVLPA
jgi:hypothetical protein